MFSFDDAGKQTVDAMLKNYADMAKGFQQIAAQTNDYSRKSFSDMATFFETLATTRSVEGAVELQANYMKTACDDFLAQAARMGDIYSDLAKSAYQPFEAAIPTKSAGGNADAH
jgi:hypothetical protein